MKHVHDTPQSSHSIQWEYDDADQTLTIRMADGSRHDYEKVPPAVFHGVTTARSAGQYFHRHVKGRYNHRPHAG